MYNSRPLADVKQTMKQKSFVSAVRTCEVISNCFGIAFEFFSDVIRMLIIVQKLKCFSQLL